MWSRLLLILHVLLAPLSSAAALLTGTGFAITTSGYIATNHHIVERASTISVRDFRGRTYPARLIRTDEANDLAILKVEGNFPALPLMRSSTVRRGDSVFTLGFPNTGLQGLSVKLTDGIVSSTSGIRDAPNSFQISVPVQPGNSGGPLINREGAVVGLVVAKLSAAAALRSGSTLPEVVNYAVKSNYLLELIETDINLSEQIRIAARTGNEQSLASLAARAEASVLLVIVSTEIQDRTPSPVGNPSPPPESVPQKPPADNAKASAEQALAKGIEAFGSKRYSDALEPLTRAAKYGLAGAQVALGYMYEHGWGVLKDEAEAARLFRDAAEQGKPPQAIHAVAMNKLGVLYLYGHGVTRDDAEAVRWFRKAAEAGDENAQHNLGEMYSKGRGVARDESEAVRWYRKAAEQGYDKSIEALRKRRLQ